MASLVEHAGNSLRKLRIKQEYSISSCVLCTTFLFAQGQIDRAEAASIFEACSFTAYEFDRMMESFHSLIQDQETVSRLAGVQVALPKAHK